LTRLHNYNKVVISRESGGHGMERGGYKQRRWKERTNSVTQQHSNYSHHYKTRLKEEDAVKNIKMVSMPGKQ